MYFNQYFIKPAFATLTSLLRTYQARPHGRLFYIYLQTSVRLSRIRLSLFFVCFNLVFIIVMTSATWSFFPFLSVGSAKVEIFSQLPNKINFIFSLLFFSLAFQFAGLSTSAPFLPKRDAKVMIFSNPADFIWNNFCAFIALTISLNRFSAHPFPPKRDAKVTKINTPANAREDKIRGKS